MKLTPALQAIIDAAQDQERQRRNADDNDYPLPDGGLLYVYEKVDGSALFTIAQEGQSDVRYVSGAHTPVNERPW